MWFVETQLQNGRDGNTPSGNEGLQRRPRKPPRRTTPRAFPFACNFRYYSPGSSFPLRLFGRGRPGGVRGPAPLCPCHGDSPAPRRVGIRPSGAKPNTGPCVPRRPRGGRSLATPTFQGGCTAGCAAAVEPNPSPLAVCPAGRRHRPGLLAVGAPRARRRPRAVLFGRHDLRGGQFVGYGSFPASRPRTRPVAALLPAVLH